MSKAQEEKRMMDSLRIISKRKRAESEDTPVSYTHLRAHET